VGWSLRAIRVVASVSLAGAIALAAWFGPSPNPFAPGPAFAASCSNKSHKLTLTNGTVSRASGTTATSFRFSVRYTDNANCKPTQVSVTIPGVGLYPLTASSSAYTGVTFFVSRRLPVGTWTYSFTAQSGSAGGSRLVTLRSVSPSRVVVTAASATPAPAPTPKPSAKATPKPTSKPGTKPTPRPSTKPGATPPSGAPVTPDGSAGPDDSDAPGGDESGKPFGPGSVDDGSGGGASGGYGFPPIFHAPAAAGLVTWLFTTAGGLLLFAFLMRRQRDQPRGLPSVLASAFAGATDGDPATQEAHIPRWRRPSVQAGRQTPRYTDAPARPPLKFAAAAPTGVERVLVQYRFVRVADSPDNIRSMELGRLDRGDEVEVVERRSGFAHVRAPDGLDGWVPRMTLAPIEAPD
jgi:hypothetical protein